MGGIRIKQEQEAEKPNKAEGGKTQDRRTEHKTDSSVFWEIFH